MGARRPRDRPRAGVVIPILRREQLRLGRERQLASRAARRPHRRGRRGRARGAQLRRVALRGGRDRRPARPPLSRSAPKLFRRKFAVKFLNNLLAQVTPFIFFAVGGYLALKGSLDIGQLVAVIAAYRDLPPPIKDLIDWDQQRQDVTIKYEQVAAQFSPPFLLPARTQPADGAVLPPDDAPIEIAGVRVVDARGSPLLDRVFLTLERPSHVALVGEHGSGRDFLARVLGRQTLAYQGEVRIGGIELSDFSEAALSRFLAFVGSDPSLQSGSIRDNLLFSVRRRAPRARRRGFRPKRRSALRRLEARRSGNPLVSTRLDWIDYEAMGIASAEEVDGALLETLDVTGGPRRRLPARRARPFRRGPAAGGLRQVRRGAPPHPRAPRGEEDLEPRRALRSRHVQCQRVHRREPPVRRRGDQAARGRRARERPLHALDPRGGGADRAA